MPTFHFLLDVSFGYEVDVTMPYDDDATHYSGADRDAAVRKAVEEVVAKLAVDGITGKVVIDTDGAGARIIRRKRGFGDASVVGITACSIGTDFEPHPDTEKVTA